jgi:uncharacterized protein
MKKIAVIGSGIAGHVATYRLKDDFDVTLYEADNRFGGHAHTSDVMKDNQITSVDTGFIVYNELTYPGLTQFFKELEVKTISTEMSFGAVDSIRGIEYSTKSINGVFAQRKNLLSPSYYNIWKDFFRFRKHSIKYIKNNPDDNQTTLGEFLEKGKYSDIFINSFLYAVAGAIWSTAPKDMNDFPLQSFLHFMINHKMLDPWGQPVWRTVPGGSRKYVEAIMKKGGYTKYKNKKVHSLLKKGNKVTVVCETGLMAEYDEVIVATHSNQALKLLSKPTQLEKDILGSIKYQSNTAVLHSDISLMPKEKRAWSAWNVYLSNDNKHQVELSYDMNVLQKIKNGSWIVTLNPNRKINENLIHKIFDYEHPYFDISALNAQRRWVEISGKDNIHYCGAYWKWGFHEDGLWSAMRVVDSIKEKYSKSSILIN